MVLPAVAILAGGGGAIPHVDAAASVPPVQPGPSAHQAFDDTTGPPNQSIPRGAPAGPLLHPRVPLPARQAGALRGAARAGAANVGTTEVLGFAQYGEVTSGAWRTDIQFQRLTTVAYFGINLAANGTVINDAGYSGWWSGETTQLINTAHWAGDRAVLTIKVFSSASIEALVGSAANRQNAINNVVGQLASRGGDGVNVDFEGSTPTVNPSDFTTFVAQLGAALRSRVPASSYLTVDTYASAAEGGTMFDISHLSPYVDAFDVMAYDITYPGSSNAGPVAPLNGNRYSDTTTMNEFLRLVPAQQVILGVPYYGYKWCVTQPAEGAGVNGGCANGSAQADTYASVVADLGCAPQLAQHYDTTYQEPWATWWSPASGDPCGGNHNSWRELFYDNAQSLGAKYDLVNSLHLRGVGIWALGYDAGALWDEVAAKLNVQHAVGALGGDARVAVAGADGTAWGMSGTSAARPVFAKSWHGLGLSIIGTPAVAGIPRSSAPATPFYIATGSDHNLWVSSESKTWQPLTPSPVYCTSGPGATTVAQTPGTPGTYLLVVGCRGADGALWYAKGPAASDPLSLPSLPGFTSLGEDFTDAPAIAAVAPFNNVDTELTFFVNDLDGRVWSRTLASPTWVQMPWACVGQPAAAAMGDTRQWTGFGCQGTDQAVWLATSSGAGWNTFSLGGRVIGGPGLAVAPGNWTVVVEGADHGLWQETNSGPWTPAGGYVTTGAGAAALLSEFRQPLTPLCAIAPRIGRWPRPKRLLRNGCQRQRMLAHRGPGEPRFPACSPRRRSSSPPSWSAWFSGRATSIRTPPTNTTRQPPAR